MGKSEGKKDQWHGHVTAVTVAPTCRKLGLANQLMNDLERISDERDCRFVDLYVRKSNDQAYRFYTKRDYFVHEEIEDYYQSMDNPKDTENAYDMHKILHNWTRMKDLSKHRSTETLASTESSEGPTTDQLILFVKDQIRAKIEAEESAKKTKALSVKSDKSQVIETTSENPSPTASKSRKKKKKSKK